MGSIALNKPSGGQTIIAPEDGTSTETITIPSGGFLEEIPSGTSVQTVSTIITTASSWSMADDVRTPLPSLNVSITPKYNNSTFLIHGRVFYEFTTNSHDILFGFLRNGVMVNANTDAPWEPQKGTAVASIGYHGDYDSTPEMLNITTYDKSAGTIAGTPIVFQLFGTSLSGTGTFNLNRTINTGVGSAYERGTSEILVQEIKG